AGLYLRPVLPVQAAQTHERGGRGGVAGGLDPLYVGGSREGGVGDERELPRLDGEDVGGRGDRGGADLEVAEHGWGGDIEGDRAVGPPAAGGGGVLWGAQLSDRLCCLAALAARL